MQLDKQHRIRAGRCLCGRKGPKTNRFHTQQNVVLKRCFFDRVDHFLHEAFVALKALVVERSAVENVKRLGLLDPSDDLDVGDADHTATCAFLSTDRRACGQQHKG